MGIKQITKKLSVVSVLAMASVGCDSGFDASRTVKQSPLNQASLGLAVQVDSRQEIDQLMLSEPNAKVRTINANHGLYEIYNVPKSVVEKYLGESEISENQLVEPLQPLSQPDVSQLAMLNSDQNGNQFQPCRPSRQKPSAKISQLSPSSTSPIVELGTDISLSSAGSANHRSVAGDLKVGWIIETPKGSNITQTQSFGKDLVLTPDSIGLYQVLLLVQDDNDSCHVTAKHYVVTANEPLKSGVTPLAAADVSEADLYHIEQVSAPLAWNQSQGEGVVIAIIDSGVNYNHPALHQNIAINEGEIPNNGLDDDHNGYVDDVVGYDFNNSDSYPFDDNGHGTHVAGLAASPVLGIAPKAKILPIKVLNALGGDQASLAGAIYYAVDRKVDVINLSLGNYGQPHSFVMRAIRYAQSSGVTVVAAAGNGHPYTGQSINTDQMPNYPSALPYDNIIAVAASSKTKFITSYSNYGKVSVDISAPGGDEDNPLVSAAMANPQGLLLEAMSGTSMASPVVAGAVALVKSARPDLSPSQIKSLLMKTGDTQTQLQDLTVSGKELNVQRALSELADQRQNIL
ncbi:MAG: hypothetical protein CL677_08795 [Bdellovibrionaceae bacterium]|nr:hypothetical protein [Pseudobdellovibrionaceae bacterium]